MQQAKSEPGTQQDPTQPGEKLVLTTNNTDMTPPDRTPTKRRKLSEVRLAPWLHVRFATPQLACLMPASLCRMGSSPRHHLLRLHLLQHLRMPQACQAVRGMHECTSHSVSSACLSGLKGADHWGGSKGSALRACQAEWLGPQAGSHTPSASFLCVWRVFPSYARLVLSILLAHTLLCVTQAGLTSPCPRAGTQSASC